jgi:hypothetical protein
MIREMALPVSWVLKKLLTDRREALDHSPDEMSQPTLAHLLDPSVGY